MQRHCALGRTAKSSVVSSTHFGITTGTANFNILDTDTPSTLRFAMPVLAPATIRPVHPSSPPFSWPSCIIATFQCIFLLLYYIPRLSPRHRTPKPYTVLFATFASNSGFVNNRGVHEIHEPLRISSTFLHSLMNESDDEAVIFFNGDRVCTAHKDPSHASNLEAYTAYKRADRKIKPVPAVFPEDARVRRTMPQDPLETLTPLPARPPDFVPNGRLTKERLEDINVNPDGFLWPEEEKLAIHILQEHQNAFVFDDTQRGTFREDYFSPYVIPVVPHVPWAFSNIPIPPGIREKVVELLREKIAAGVYEPSQSSYRSRWFCVLKKSGKLRIVHDLQPLNKVTIRDAGLPPNLDSFVEPFAGRQCYTVFDLHWGFDARKVAVGSRDLTAFLTPLGLLRITSLPTGFTNSPAEFQACMSFILQDEIPHIADVFIDDLPIKGPATRYADQNGNAEVLSENPGIRRFIWEHLQDVHRIVHRVQSAGGTFSPGKLQMARETAHIVGQKCTPQGRLPDPLRVQKVQNWPPLKSVKDVRGFLGLCGTMRIWIEQYSARARPLTMLTRHDAEFTWEEEQQRAFDDLKAAITSTPVLRPIDYACDRPVYLSVDSSLIAVGFILSQIDEEGRKRPSRYGSIPMNEREARYSQPKLELYGLFRALRAYRLHIIGVQALKVEVDAKYIRGMLNDPDLQPNATINRWIQGILLFDFELIHVPAERHKGPDALSRKERASDEESGTDDDTWLDNIALYTAGPTRSEGRWFRVWQASASAPSKNDASAPPELGKYDKTLVQTYDLLTTFRVPSEYDGQRRRRFIQRATKFFVQQGVMFKRRPWGTPVKCIFGASARTKLLHAAHEETGHHGEQATFQLLKERFFWPTMWNDCRQHVRSCHECQIRSVRKHAVPLIVSTPATLFTRIYLDIMHMPRAHGYKYIIAARDDLTAAAEGRALQRATAAAVSRFFWEEILCRYGAVGQVTTDNGPEFQEAFSLLMNKYGIPQIKISPYNSRANGVVERGHFVIREAIIKACGGKPSDWPKKVSHAFFADKVTIRRSRGFSPFYLLHGVDPVLPFDLAEASFLVDGFTRDLSSSELLALRIRQLEKRAGDIERAKATLVQLRYRSKEQFEKRFRTKLRTTDYAPGDLVLVRNSPIEQSHDRKSKPRFNGPYEVVRRTKGGSYVLQELDGSIWRQGVAAFRLYPYVPRSNPRLAELAMDLDRVDHASDDSEGSANHDDSD